MKDKKNNDKITNITVLNPEILGTQVWSILELSSFKIPSDRAERLSEEDLLDGNYDDNILEADDEKDTFI